MRNNIIPRHLVPEGFMHQNSDYDKHNNHLSISSRDIEEKNAELENEHTKQKTPPEKGAKLMQIIWGDNFLSDSLH